MPKATLVFNLPEEQEEYDCTMAAPRVERALRDIMEAWRSHRKYDAPAVTEDSCWEILNENDIQDLF